MHIDAFEPRASESNYDRKPAKKKSLKSTKDSNISGPREKFSRPAVHRSWPDVHVDAHRLPAPGPQKAVKIETLSQE